MQADKNMLKKIVFVIKDNGQIPAVRQLKYNMEADGTERMIDIWTFDELRRDAGYNDKETIYVTDSGEMLQTMSAQGKYVIALLTDNNKEENMSGASYAVTDIEELALESFEKAYLRLAGLPWQIGETGRCMIREMTVEDVDDFYRIYAEPSITRYMDALYENPEDEREYTRQYIRQMYGFYGYGLWSIIEKKSGELIGRAGLSWRAGFDIPELGFVIAVPFQRQGYAYEVCREILRYGREELEFEEVQALVKKGNEASENLCRKLGMSWRDTVEECDKLYERYVICMND